MFHRLFFLILIAITGAGLASAAPVRGLKPDIGSLVHNAAGGRPAARVVPEYRPPAPREELRPSSDPSQHTDKPPTDWKPKPDAFDELLEEYRPSSDPSLHPDRPSSDWQPKPEAFDELLKEYDKNRQKPDDKLKSALPGEATPDTRKHVDKEVDDTGRPRCDDDKVKRNEC